jgi:hypothetical protein
MSSPTPFRTLIWTLMAAYAAWFLVLFTKGLAAAQRVRTGPAAMLATVGFVVYQGLFIVFNR